MTPREELEKVFNQKSDTFCPACNGSGRFDYEVMSKVTIYGKSLKEISEIIDFAYKNGYKKKG